ncbi:hypothetical protein K501DRAFT_285400 [Backusella circina FSU 941]|nr:hypothetical protein K501DRAFT_285400 [Backusella circina FSU 941]
MTNTGPKEYIEKLKQITNKRSALQADIELQYLEEASSILNKENSISVPAAKKQKNTTTKDQVKVPGLLKTLGESLLDRIPTTAERSKKEDYFYYLSKNIIFDLSDTSSGAQLTWFSPDVEKAIKERYIVEKPEHENQNITSLLKNLNKIKRGFAVSRVLAELESYKTTELKSKNIKRIYEHVLRIHAEKTWMLSKEARANYTEMDFQIKFWGPVFETFFSSPSVVLHWGDSLSDPCLKKNLKFKLDLRLLLFSHEEVIVDGMNGEVAKQATKAKLYGDRLKSVLATKCHINNFLATIPYLDVASVKKILFPILQIMGLNVHVLVLRLGNKGIYVLQEMATFRFPTTTVKIKDNLKEMIDGLALIETLIDNLKQIYETSQLADEDTMERIVNETRKIKKFNSSSWISEVVWSNPDDSDKDDEDEDVESCAEKDKVEDNSEDDDEEAEEEEEEEEEEDGGEERDD